MHLNQKKTYLSQFVEFTEDWCCINASVIWVIISVDNGLTPIQHQVIAQNSL